MTITMTSAEFMIDAVVKNIAITKDVFKEVITDQTYPLNERWSFWCKAPMFLKEEEWFIQHFDIEEENEICWIEWFDAPYYKEKHQTINLASFIHDIEWDIKYANEHPEYKEGQKESPWSDRVLLDRFKEEILSKNIGSFVLDW